MLSVPVSPRIADQRREAEDGRTQRELAPAHVAHRFDEGVGVDEAARRLAMSRATFYRRFDELVARGLEELERLTPGRRVFSASSIERVLHGATVTPQDGGR